MAEPRITVVIPAYNAARFLSATLESAGAQTFRNREVVVVDDGSSDQTSDIVRAVPGVRLFQQANAGVAAARNRGVRETRSEWVAFLDADDLWLPEKLEVQLQSAEETGAGAIFCDLKIIDSNGAAAQAVSHGVEVSLELEPLLMHSASIPQGTSSTILVRRSVLESIGLYDESLATMADWDLLIRLRLSTTFAHVPRQMVAYRRYPGTMSRNVAMLERESQVILDKVFSQPDLPSALRRLESESRAWNDLVLSGSHFEAGNALAAVRFGLRAVTRNPRLAGRVAAWPLRSARRSIGQAP